MSRRRPYGAAALAGAVTVSLAALAPAAPAAASAGETPGGYVSRSLPGCTAYGSSSGFGIACEGPGGGGTTLRDLLLGAPVPTCWEEPPPPEFVGDPRPGPGRWWLRTCLDGLDPVTLAVDAHGLQLSYGYVYLPPGGEVHLTDGQRRFVDAVITRGQVPIPYPVVVTSPAASPRVGEPVAFSLTGPTTTRTLRVGGVTMTAHVVSLAVEPEGPAGPTVRCSGPGRVLRPDEVGTVDLGDQTDDVCAYRYDRSSAGQGVGEGDADRYPARVTASWLVVFGDGSTLGPFATSAVNEVRVAEVQTLVVTGSEGA